MMTRLRYGMLLAVLVTLGALVFAFHPEAEELEDNGPPAVSESDLQLYINVYLAMQQDHDLTIDNAIKSHQISLEDFRQLERRIQSQGRLVDRVRQALLERAKAHSEFALNGSSPTPAGAATPSADKGHGAQKK